VFLKEFESKGLDLKEYGWRGLRTQEYTYVIHKGYLPGEEIQRLLYENVKDPFQLNPISGDQLIGNELADKLDMELRQWLLKLKDPFIIHLES